MHSIDVNLLIFNFDEGFLNTAFAHADGLYLCSEQLDSCLKFLVNKEIMICFFVVGYQLNAAHFSHIPLPPVLFPLMCGNKVDGPRKPVTSCNNDPDRLA